MGLKPDQLPSYIYRMRLFGYPPGWLMEANRKTSTLAMYDKDGNGKDSLLMKTSMPKICTLICFILFNRVLFCEPFLCFDLYL